MANKDYQAIARKKIRTPRDSPKRVLVYSRNKKGKTTFCNSAPNVLFLDPEDGTKALMKSKPAIWPVESWVDIDEAYRFLKLGKHDYQWVAVDGTTRMSSMALRYIMRQEEQRDLDRRPGIIDRRDYGKSGELFKQMLLNFDTLPMGVIYTAQERIVEIDDAGNEGDDDAENVRLMFVPDLPKGARGALNSIVDVIGRLYVVPATKKVRRSGEIVEVEYRQRRLWIGDHGQYDTGARSEHKLPMFLKDPSVDRLMKLIETGDARG